MARVDKGRAFLKSEWAQLLCLTAALIIRPSMFLESHWWSILVGLVAMVSLVITLMASQMIPGFEKKLKSAVKRQRRVRQHRTGKGELSYLAGSLAGVSEEAFFRGALQPIIGIVPTAILFALGHGGFERDTFPLLLLSGVIGLVLGLWYLLTTDIWVPIIGHSLFNCLMTAIKPEED